MVGDKIKMAGRWKSCFSVSHVIIIVGVFVVLRITWLSIHNMLHASPSISDQPLGHNFDGFLSPKECVPNGNSTCIPVQPNDVYLGHGLYAHGSQLFLDGQPFRILSGSFHYFRTQPTQWADRLMKMKAAGLNTVMSYIPWNLHEPIKGHYVFSGDWDLASFIKQAQKIGLKVILRPGPYISGEWDFGGLPSWLLSDHQMRVRQSYQPYLRHIEEYFAKLLYVLAPLSYKKGGPIIAFQIENEYGSYGEDKAYLNFLLSQFKKWHIEELFFTSLRAKLVNLNNGSLDGVLMAVNIMDRQIDSIGDLKRFQRDKPLLVTGFGPHCCGHWGERCHVTENHIFEQYVTEVLKLGASMNFYVFVGGTNFGFWNGAGVSDKGKGYMPSITSHDCDAPVSEHGSLTSKFFIVRRLMSQLITDMDELPDIAMISNSTYGAYGEINIERWMSYKSLTDIAQDLNLARYDKEIVLKQPVSMEELHLTNGCGQNTGWLLYRTEINQTDRPLTLTIDGTIQDRAQFIVDYKQVAVWYQTTNGSEIKLSQSGRMSVLLDILVENMGRVSDNPLNNQRKGILGKVDMNNLQPMKWLHIPLDFDEEFISTISQHGTWQSFSGVFAKVKHQRIKAPAFFMTNLNLDSPPKDTFIDMKSWNKGIIIVNNFVIGRYWHIGPQRTLYVPGSILLQGRNTVIVFELHRPGNTLTFVDRPNLDSRW
ncbi:hypothetical protein LSH36_367g01028 [Paralvinella palmiformis]|uniref:Beta-galactosidase n=1 Tax=Paralvinella palmiformis TaxID=53620 RepID=A0AAD9N0V1_9ANNE|nr:hypothetical protein LSH36_367g01028 [Paralvinella palmiformis]